MKEPCISWLQPTWVALSETVWVASTVSVSQVHPGWAPFLLLSFSLIFQVYSAISARLKENIARGHFLWLLGFLSQWLVTFYYICTLKMKHEESWNY